MTARTSRWSCTHRGPTPLCMRTALTTGSADPRTALRCTVDNPQWVAVEGLVGAGQGQARVGVRGGRG